MITLILMIKVIIIKENLKEWITKIITLTCVVIETIITEIIKMLIITIMITTVIIINNSNL